MITGLLNVELLVLQDGYLGGETTNVNSEWEAARNEPVAGVRVMEMSLAIVRFAGDISCTGNNEGDFRMGGY